MPPAAKLVGPPLASEATTGAKATVVAAAPPAKQSVEPKGLPPLAPKAATKPIEQVRSEAKAEFYNRVVAKTQPAGDAPKAIFTTIDDSMANAAADIDVDDP